MGKKKDERGDSQSGGISSGFFEFQLMRMKEEAEDLEDEDFDDEDFEDDEEAEDLEDDDFEDEDYEDYEDYEDEEDELSLQDIMELVHQLGLPENPGLHDLFNISEEEERSWYTFHEGAYPDFESLMRELEKPREYSEPLVANGDIRQAARHYHEELIEYLIQKLIEQEDKEEIDTKDVCLFLTACYVFAEYHVEDGFSFIVDWLIGCGDEVGEVLGAYFYQHMPSILYATFDGGFGPLFELMEDYIDQIGDDNQKVIGRALAMVCKEMSMDQEEQESLIGQYLSLLEEEDTWEGDSAAIWIVQAGLQDKMRGELRNLLTNRIDPMMYGTTNPSKFAKLIQEGREVETDLVMDDCILMGMYPAAIKVNPSYRARVKKEGRERLFELPLLL